MARTVDLDAPEFIEPAEARLRPPAIQSEWTHRTALVNRLRADHAPFVVIAAPAGYGKTTLIAQWARRDERPFAWVRLLPGEGHPVALLRALAESLSQLAPPEDAIAFPVRPRAVLRVDTAARRLGRWVLHRPAPFVLAIDNADYLDSPEAFGVLETIAEHLPEGSRLVLSGRCLTALPLARRRAQGFVEEITAEDLRFSNREAAKLFAALGVELSDEACDDLNERAEGWATGLALAALALEPHSGHPARSPQSFTGDHRYVSEFFEAEVLGKLAPADVAFLTHVALLDRLSGPACDALLRVNGSGARLERLARRGVFLVPLDREARTYRFHHFFRATMRNRLEQRESARFVELSRRAAVAAEREGDFAAGIDYLRRIGDLPGALRLLGAAGPDVFARGVLDTLESSLVDLADHALLTSNQAAAATGAMAQALLGHPVAAARWTSAADEARPKAALPDGTASSKAWLGLLHAALCRDGAERMLEDARAAMKLVPRRSPVAGFAKLLQGVGHVLLGDADAAEQAFSEAVELGTSTHASLVLALGLSELALIAHEKGDWVRADELVLAARDAVERLDDDNAATALVYAVSARLALHNSNWVRVSDDIDRVHDLLPRVTEALPWLSGQVRIELARTHLALNSLPAVRELLAELDVLMLARPHLGNLRAQSASLAREVDELLTRSPGANSGLTAAELRLLPLLTTHLTFRQIGEHLYVSRNTIKTQAISVYRKLGVSSRAEAIERAHQLGFLRSDRA